MEWWKLLERVFCVGTTTWWTSIKFEPKGKERIISIMTIMTLTVSREIIKIYALLQIRPRRGAIFDNGASSETNFSDWEWRWSSTVELAAHDAVTAIDCGFIKKLLSSGIAYIDNGRLHGVSPQCFFELFIALVAYTAFIMTCEA